MSTLLLNRLIHGYDDLEPVILGLMATDKSFILIGRHGTGKTKMAKWLSQGYGDGSFVFYDATKDDLISIAGIPDPESIKVGKLRFIGHERSIWDKSVIVVDEITRAAKENQNLWLEILEEHTCFGLPLKYRSIIATANPESYAAAFQLDEALLDRFYAVIPVPEMQNGIDSYDIRQMVNLSLMNGGDVSKNEILKVFNEIKQAQLSLISEGAAEKISMYLAEIIPPILNMLREQNNLYMSPRTYCHILPEAILSIAAYFKVAGSAEPLQNAAIQALRYSVATKLQTNPLAIEQHHRSASVILKGGTVSANERLRIDLNSFSDLEKQLDYLAFNWSAIKVEFTDDELEKTLRKIYKDVIQTKNNRELLKLQAVLISVDYTGETLRQLKGKLGASVFKAQRKLLPVVQQYLLPESPGKNVSKATHQKLVLLESVLKDSQFISATSPELLEVKSLVLNICDKYDNPVIEDVLTEIKILESHSEKK
jgi:MoxR-like ATPase